MPIKHITDVPSVCSLKQWFDYAILLRSTEKLSINARDTLSDKMSNATSWMENSVVCHTIRFLSYKIG